jgi:aromatic ring-cleaving dioxygenase
MNDLEKLKLCAKAVGHETRIQNDEVFIHYSDEGCDGWIHYDPEHNDAQAMELLKWLWEQELEIKLIGGNRVEILDHERKRLWWGEGDTLNLTIINAVCAMEGEG